MGTFHAPSKQVSSFQHQRNDKQREAVNTGAATVIILLPVVTRRCQIVCRGVGTFLRASGHITGMAVEYEFALSLHLPKAPQK